jgi:hypothetical protein
MITNFKTIITIQLNRKQLNHSIHDIDNRYQSQLVVTGHTRVERVEEPLATITNIAASRDNHQLQWAIARLRRA